MILSLVIERIEFERVEQEKQVTREKQVEQEKQVERDEPVERVERLPTFQLEGHKHLVHSLIYISICQLLSLNIIYIYRENQFWFA